MIPRVEGWRHELIKVFLRTNGMKVLSRDQMRWLGISGVDESDVKGALLVGKDDDKV